MAEKIHDKYLSPYSPSEVEERVYEEWEKSGYFNPDKCIEGGICSPDAETFSMVLPPPNVTGVLHIGHALEHSIQDTVTRYNGMKGKRTLWIPGTDHAAIATQARFETKIYKEEGKTRHDFSREEFFSMVHAFGLQNQKKMQGQMRLLGASLDWSREAFTLDEKREKAVRTAFKKMYEDGLIYRKSRVINWDPKGQTTVSDDEVEHQEEKGVLYTFKYSNDFPIPIATTRPETKFGDTAIAVNPNDARYKEYVGQTFETDFLGVPISIKIVADDAVDPEFGTGAVGVTPAHSMTDWEIAERHNLPLKQVIDERAKTNESAGSFAGLNVRNAREEIVKKLEEAGLMISKKEIDQNIARSYRTNGIIEPIPKLQWFVDVNKEFDLVQSKIQDLPEGSTTTLRKLMRTAVESGQIAFLPERFRGIYFHWIDNLKDWCISRQILYGHRIPVWYRENETYVGTEGPTGEGWQQDSDTLDTWFSSALWTFSTLGWPEETSDLKTYHPTTLIDPGYEIIFFWVARMILASGYLLGEIPFETVYIHGMVRDDKGRKFSKSLNNGIEPEEVMKRYGTDALRMSLLVGIGPGSDANFDLQKVKAYKNFANKLWNVARFVLENTDPSDWEEKPSLRQKDQADVDNLEGELKDITGDIEGYRFHLASEKIYHYVWHTFADEILEDSKAVLAEGSESDKASVKWTLRHILRESLKTLHPFMPFITEEIWRNAKAPDENMLMVTRWPVKIKE